MDKNYEILSDMGLDVGTDGLFECSNELIDKVYKEIDSDPEMCKKLKSGLVMTIIKHLNVY